MATAKKDVNIGNNASISQEDISSTASMSGGSIPSNISDLSTDSDRQSVPRSAFKSAMELSTVPTRSQSQSQNGDVNTTADREETGGTSQNESQGTSQSKDMPQEMSIRNMLLEFSTKIESSQRTLAVSVKDEMKEIKEVLTPIKESIDEANRKIDIIERDHGAKIAENRNQIVDTNTKLHNAELRIQQLQQQISAHKPHAINSINPGIIGRMNNIVISGIKENQDENLKAKLDELAADLNCELSSFKARRLGKPKEDATKSRQILLELSSNWEKRKLYAARTKLKNHSKSSLNSVFFNEDLDKSSSELYYKARQAKKSNKIKSVWTYGCQVFFTNLGSEQPILLNLANQLPAVAVENVPTNISVNRDRSTALSNGSLRTSPEVPPGNQ